MEKIDPQAIQHKFDQPMRHPLTYRKLYELRFASHFIPYLKILENMIGYEQVIKSLQELAFHGAKEFAEQIVKTAGKNDLSVFKGIYDPTNPDLCDILTMEVIESTEETYEFRVTECLLAQVFRKAGAADYGYAAICSDVLIARLVNPQIGLELDGTIMEGKPCCKYRYYVKP